MAHGREEARDGHAVVDRSHERACGLARGPEPIAHRLGQVARDRSVRSEGEDAGPGAAEGEAVGGRPFGWRTALRRTRAGTALARALRTDPPGNDRRGPNRPVRVRGRGSPRGPHSKRRPEAARRTAESPACPRSAGRTGGLRWPGRSADSRVCGRAEAVRLIRGSRSPRGARPQGCRSAARKPRPHPRRPPEGFP